MSESFAQLFEESLKGLETRQGSIVSYPKRLCAC